MMEYNSEIKNGKNNFYAFATYPDVVMYDSKDGEALTHLIFGDYINLLPDRNQQDIKDDDDWVYVRSRGKNGWIKKDQLQKNRILEINFVDIGQGDGCHIVTAEDQQIIIDAGQEDNMHRFLSWRFNLRKDYNKMKDVIGIISHPDQDHYLGFAPIFENTQINFTKIYHNGIVERANDPGGSLGSTTKIRNKKFLSDLKEDDASVRNLLADEDKRYSTSNNRKYPKKYPVTLFKAVQNQANTNMSFLSLNSDMGYVDGFEQDRNLSLKILGPVCEQDENAKNCLKYFSSNIGKTKNGHSVSLMLEIGKLKVFLGGDLNVEAENYLLKQYTGIDPAALLKKIKKEDETEELKKLKKEYEDLLEKGREIYQAHIAKACHHGSHHFTTEFLKSVNPVATIISSGDNESHGHPRPDALGAFGKYARGERPLIFSTELARSAKETIKRPHEYKRSIKYYINALQDNTLTDKKRKNFEKKLEGLLENIERSVAVYGMINVRTDGEQVIICQKLESPRSKSQKWDIHELIWDDTEKDFKYHIKLKH